MLNNPLAAVDPYGLDCIYLFDDGTYFDKPGDCYSESDNGYYVDGTVTSVTNQSGEVTINYNGNCTPSCWGSYTDTSPYYYPSSAIGGITGSQPGGPSTPGNPGGNGNGGGSSGGNTAANNGQPQPQQLQNQVNQLQQKVNQLQKQIQRPSYCKPLAYTAVALLAVAEGAEYFSGGTGEVTPPAWVGHAVAYTAFAADVVVGGVLVWKCF